MKLAIFPWSLQDESTAALKAMKKRLFWHQIAAIEGRHQIAALEEKIKYTKQVLREEAEESEAFTSNL